MGNSYFAHRFLSYFQTKKKLQELQRFSTFISHICIFTNIGIFILKLFSYSYVIFILLVLLMCILNLIRKIELTVFNFLSNFLIYINLWQFGNFFKLKYFTSVLNIQGIRKNVGRRVLKPNMRLTKCYRRSPIA